jgi:hypothetical protein
MSHLIIIKELSGSVNDHVTPVACVRNRGRIAQITGPDLYLRHVHVRKRLPPGKRDRTVSARD